MQLTVKKRLNLRSRLLVLERLDFDSLDTHDCNRWNGCGMRQSVCGAEAIDLVSFQRSGEKGIFIRQA